MTITKYEELQALTEKYGEETLVFHKYIRDIGPKIVKAYNEYLGGPERAANAVPPDGDFEPHVRYNDSAFSDWEHSTKYLKAISMGICTEIGNQSDEGATWVRTVIKFQPSGGAVILLIGDSGKKIYLHNNPEAVMDDICESIFQDTRDAFSLELDEAKGHSQIGFAPNPSPS